jgi:DNA-binding NarL/FixJ family response regulator
MEVVSVTSNSSGPILLASDFPIFRDSLKAHLEQETDIKIIGCAKSVLEVIPMLHALEPKLTLLDLNLPLKELCGLVHQIYTSCAVRTLVMSDGLDCSQVTQLILHGAHGVVPRRTTRELLTKSIHAVLAGDFWIKRAIVNDLVALIRENASAMRMKTSEAKIKNPEIPSAFATTRINPPGRSEAEIARLGLTRREMQVIGALVDGQTNKDIASTFNISEYTVKHHLTNIYDKLGVYNRVELVLFAINRELCVSPRALATAAGL